MYVCVCGFHEMKGKEPMPGTQRTCGPFHACEACTGIMGCVSACVNCEEGSIDVLEKTQHSQANVVDGATARCAVWDNFGLVRTSVHLLCPGCNDRCVRAGPLAEAVKEGDALATRGVC